MNDLRTAAQQALVALDELYYSNSTPLAEKLYEEASAALRAALAEPHDPVAYNGWVLREVLFDKGEPVGHREPAKAEPEQEPVPNGATHYQPHQKAYYKRVSATEWYLWSCAGNGWIPSKGTSDSADWIMLSPLSKTPQPAKQPQEPSVQGVLFAVEEAIRNGDCPWQIEQAFDDYEAERMKDIKEGL